MSDNSINNKRIAKNTIFLYIRMFLLMVVGLITSRVMLQALGVENFGIQSVVAGFSSMFGILTNSLSTAISRFITVQLGKNNLHKLKAVFSTSLVVQMVMGIILLVTIETIGIWFVSSQMNIPEGRENAALWCLHCAAITMVINLMNVPFNSAIIAHEKMSAFAYMSILETVLKLVICYALFISPFDKLKVYAVLLVVASCLTNFIYFIYCRVKFEECSTRLRFQKNLFKEIWSFAGWNFFGNTAWMLNTQGVNMLLNIFFDVTVNAARGVANQANAVIEQFVNNFMVALNPQITKSYAAGDPEYAFQLVNKGARFSFYIMLIISMPLIIESKMLLCLWLGTPPDQAAEFFCFTVIATLATVLTKTLIALQNAHGNIRHYQIWITVFGYLPFPLTWFAFLWGLPAIWAYITYFVVYWFLNFVRLYLVNQSTKIPIKAYLVDVIIKCHIVFLVSYIMPFLIHTLLSDSFVRLICVTLFSILSTIVAVYFIGINKEERTMIKAIFLKYLRI